MPFPPSFDAQNSMMKSLALPGRTCPSLLPQAYGPPPNDTCSHPHRSSGKNGQQTAYPLMQEIGLHQGVLSWNQNGAHAQMLPEIAGRNRSAAKRLFAQQRERGFVTYGCRAWLRRSLKQEARKKMAAPKGRPFLFAFCPPPGAAAIFSGLRTPPDLLPASAILPAEAARSPRDGGSPAYCSPASTTPDNGEPPPGPHTYKSFHGPGRRSGTPAYRGG